MALYTELFSEYLENGGELPAIFDEITGFKEHFIRYYCDKEIGFETESLFKIKLEEAGAVLIPLYKPRLANYDTLIASVGTGRLTTTNSKLGETNGNVTELPFDGVSAEPASKTHTDEVVNETNVKEELTDDERRRAVEFLEREAKSVMKRLLDDFAPCFMCVF